MSGKVVPINAATQQVPDEIEVPPGLELTKEEVMEGWAIAYKDGHAYKFMADYRSARLVAETH
jgi:hypothetical protein